MTEIFSVNCPTCHKSVQWVEENAYRPFCSKRCQLIDLGEWVAEEKVIAGESLDFTLNGEFNDQWK